MVTTGTGTDFGLIQDILIAIGLFGGIILYRKNNVPQKNIAELTSLTDAYEKRIKVLEDEIKNNHKVQLENVAAIAELQGQLSTYKDLPLKDWADSVKSIAVSNKTLANGIKEVSTSNKAILEELRSSASISATAQADGGLVVRTTDKNPLKVK